MKNITKDSVKLIKAGNIEQISNIFNQGDIDNTDKQGLTTLHIASKHNKPDLLV